MGARTPARTRFVATLHLVLLVAGVSLVLVGLASTVAGGLFLKEGNSAVRLSAASGPDVPIPAKSTVLGGSVTVYTPERATDSPVMLGCELVEADGDVASGNRIGGFDFALGDPVTVDGATWYPFAQIEVLPEPSTLRCSEADLTTLALSQESTFGRSTLAFGAIALGFGLFAIVLGAAALVAARMVRR